MAGVLVLGLVLGGLWLAVGGSAEVPRGEVGDGARERTTRAGEPPVRRASEEPAAVAQPPSAASAATGARLLVVVADTPGLAVEGARITLEGEPESGPTAAVADTDAGGRARLEALSPGRYAYRVEAPGRPVLVSTKGIELVRGAEAVLEITLADYALTIRGRVVDGSGHAVEGIEIGARRYRSPLEEGLVRASSGTRTGAGGEFEITRLRPGDYSLRTAANDRYTAARALVRAGEEAAVLTVSEVGPVLRISGVVTDPDGAPIAGVRVLPLGQPGRHTSTDAAGRYVVRLAGGGEKVMRFLRAGYRVGRIKVGGVAEGAAVERDLVLDPLGPLVSVSGQLRDDRGAAVAGEILYLGARELGTRYRSESAADGTFVFPEVATGARYRLWVRPRGPYADYARELIDPGQAPLDIVLSTLATGTLAGRVVDRQGGAVAQLTLRARNPVTPGKVREAVTDDQGYFRIESVPAGSLTLETRSTPRVRVQGIELGPGVEQYTDVVLDVGTRVLEGRVLDEGGYPLQGARLRLESAGEPGVERVTGGITRTAVTDADGEFRFTGLADGDHEIRVTGVERAGPPITVSAGQSWVEWSISPSDR